MNRAILVALGTFVVISTAAFALDIAGATAPSAPSTRADPVQVALARGSAREEQRGRIQERYAIERDSCTALRGYQREKCLVKAHANRGRALLEAAAPYENRVF